MRYRRLADQYQEDIPPVKPIIRRFRVHIGRSRECGRRAQGRRPLQTSDALFTHLHRPEMGATNWRAEHAVRPAVVNRKTSGGSRSDRGAEAQGVLASVFRTARQQGAIPKGFS